MYDGLTCVLIAHRTWESLVHCYVCLAQALSKDKNGVFEFASGEHLWKMYRKQHLSLFLLYINIEIGKYRC